MILKVASATALSYGQPLWLNDLVISNVSSISSISRFELVSTVCVEDMDAFEALINCHKCLFHKSCCFVGTSTVTDDLTIKEVDKYTYVIPVCSNPDICQITYYYYVSIWPFIKLTIHNICCFRFITGILLWMKLGCRIC